MSNNILYMQSNNQNTTNSSNAVDLDELIRDRTCSCGKMHTCDIKKLVIQRGALAELGNVIKSVGNFSDVVMVCDENTYAAAGKKAEELCGFSATVILPPEDLHANEHGVELCEKALPNKVDLLVAVGSGTVHDITRYTAYMRGIKFISVPTAASVDGFVSNVAAMTLRGAKKTIPAGMPIAMVADVDIIAASPMRLTASGVGDMIAKYTALIDWRIAHLLAGEYICEEIISLVEEALVKVKESAPGLSSREPEAYATLIYGLVLSGIAMQFAGISRPASGAEHHISHFIEMTVPFDKCSALHGEKVGVGERTIVEYYHKLASMTDAEIRAIFTDRVKITEELIQRFFGDLTPEIIKENENSCSENISTEAILVNFNEIRALIKKYLPTLAEIDTVYDEVNACKTFADIGLPEEFKATVLTAAPLIRNRLTLLRMSKYN